MARRGDASGAEDPADAQGAAEGEIGRRAHAEDEAVAAQEATAAEPQAAGERERRRSGRDAGARDRCRRGGGAEAGGGADYEPREGDGRTGTTTARVAADAAGLSRRREASGATERGDADGLSSTGRSAAARHENESGSLHAPQGHEGVTPGAPSGPAADPQGSQRPRDRQNASLGSRTVSAVSPCAASSWAVFLQPPSGLPVSGSTPTCVPPPPPTAPRRASGVPSRSLSSSASPLSASSAASDESVSPLSLAGALAASPLAFAATACTPSLSTWYVQQISELEQRLKQQDEAHRRELMQLTRSYHIQLALAARGAAGTKALQSSYSRAPPAQAGTSRACACACPSPVQPPRLPAGSRLRLAASQPSASPVPSSTRQSPPPCDLSATASASASSWLAAPSPPFASAGSTALEWTAEASPLDLHAGCRSSRCTPYPNSAFPASACIRGRPPLRGVGGGEGCPAAEAVAGLGGDGDGEAGAAGRSCLLLDALLRCAESPSLECGDVESMPPTGGVSRRRRSSSFPAVPQLVLPRGMLVPLARAALRAAHRRRGNPAVGGRRGETERGAGAREPAEAKAAEAGERRVSSQADEASTTQREDQVRDSGRREAETTRRPSAETRERTTPTKESQAGATKGALESGGVRLVCGSPPRGSWHDSSAQSAQEMDREAVSGGEGLGDLSARPCCTRSSTDASLSRTSTLRFSSSSLSSSVASPLSPGRLSLSPTSLPSLLASAADPRAALAPAGGPAPPPRAAHGVPPGDGDGAKTGAAEGHRGGKEGASEEDEDRMQTEKACREQGERPGGETVFSVTAVKEDDAEKRGEDADGDSREGDQRKRDARAGEGELQLSGGRRQSSLTVPHAGEEAGTKFAGDNEKRNKNGLLELALTLQTGAVSARCRRCSQEVEVRLLPSALERAARAAHSHGLSAFPAHARVCSARPELSLSSFGDSRRPARAVSPGRSASNPNSRLSPLLASRRSPLLRGEPSAASRSSSVRSFFSCVSTEEVPAGGVRLAAEGAVSPAPRLPSSPPLVPSRSARTSSSASPAFGSSVASALPPSADAPPATHVCALSRPSCGLPPSLPPFFPPLLAGGVSVGGGAQSPASAAGRAETDDAATAGSSEGAEREETTAAPSRPADGGGQRGGSEIERRRRERRTEKSDKGEKARRFFQLPMSAFPITGVAQAVRSSPEREEKKKP
ncbi:hypothetical protein BESB_015830 [Besnoitia besnoiti]|uniref:Uncharacterized protein n=1 Tax=Besnoitia besnoiti TaxID=94643 RepID=A0A2A9M2S1_BESBE|nr:hypothetical protein BESB_015830 [Besnoitia besnoiti]PFH32265.1 hypothetical protein BESB_015830 [Besnoitia besnoiti]